MAYILAFVVTLAYFVPLQDMVKGEAGAKIPVAELRSMLSQFMTFNYIRQAIGLLAFGAALHALGLSYRMAGRRER